MNKKKLFNGEIYVNVHSNKLRQFSDFVVDILPRNNKVSIKNHIPAEIFF